MKRRFPVLILSLTLLLCATARAAAPRLVVHLPEGPIEAGENFTVTVDLTGNPGILNIEFTLSFDRERMECTDMRIGELLASQAGASAVNPAANTGAILAAVSASLMEGDGPVGVYQFEAKEKLTDFHFSIDRINIGNEDTKQMDVLVTTDGGAKSDTGATNGSAGKSDTGTSNGSAGKSDTGTTSGTAGKSNTGTTSGSADKSNTGTTNGSADKSNTGTTNGSAGQPDTGATSSPATSNAAASKSETAAPPPFTDIAGTWAENYIREAVERNLFQGYPDGTFRPDNRLTRAQFVMVLWNLAGRPTVPEASPFADMDGQIENFRNAVAWAYAKGYVNGTSPDTFSPGEPLTRQAAVKILFAYHGAVRGPEVMVAQAYDDLFSDGGKISAWARDAMYWAVYQKILSGTTSSTLEPGGPVTRAQLAAIMVRYAERFPA